MKKKIQKFKKKNNYTNIYIVQYKE